MVSRIVGGLGAIIGLLGIVLCLLMWSYNSDVKPTIQIVPDRTDIDTGIAWSTYEGVSISDPAGVLPLHLAEIAPTPAVSPTYNNLVEELPFSNSSILVGGTEIIRDTGLLGATPVLVVDGESCGPVVGIWKSWGVYSAILLGEGLVMHPTWSPEDSFDDIPDFSGVDGEYVVTYSGSFTYLVTSEWVIAAKQPSVEEQ